MNSKVLIGCEESGTITSAMRRKGIEAYSCDLQPTRGNPDWHIQGDVMDAVRSRQWDMIILHPDCTAMAVSGNRWYGRGMPRHQQRVESIEWTTHLWSLAKHHSHAAALENPVSVIFSHVPDHVQYVQPWQYGHGETKRTGFALYNLPPLTPTNIVSGREGRVFNMPPGPNRKRDRSKTYQGIADAIAEQWGSLLCQH
jgi:hypothetical protein